MPSDLSLFRPSPNVAPTSSLPVLSSSQRSGAAAVSEAPLPLSIEIMRWGISTGSPSLPLVINARSETAPALARFARLLSSPLGRGVLAADGYYEWEEKSKQPYFVRRSDGEPMLLALLVERGGGGRRRGGAFSPPFGGAKDEGSGGGGGGGSETEDQQRQQQPRFAILTRSPPKALRWLHERSPCVLPSEDLANEWLLGSGSDAAASAKGSAAAAAAAAREASELLSRSGAAVEASFGGGRESPASPPLLSWHPVTKEVGKTSYQRGDASKDARSGGIASLFGKAAKRKEQGELAAARERGSPSPRPRPSRSGEKRKQEGGFASASNHKQRQLQLQLQLQPSKRAKHATTTTPGKGQRSLDFFLSPKKEDEEKT